MRPPLPAPTPRGHDLCVDLGEVYACYGDWIRAKVRGYLPDAWEDGVQEVLVKLSPALERMHTTGTEAVRALVSRTVRSVCIDELRRRARQPAVARRAASTEPEELEDPSSVRELDEQDELLARVRACWSTLAERERRILVLRFHDGLSFREIAELLDVPQGSVAGWYSRAVDQLREVRS